MLHKAAKFCRCVYGGDINLPPIIQTSVKFHDFAELYLSSFHQTSFKLGNVTDFVGLFPAMLTYFFYGSSQKLNKLGKVFSFKDYNILFIFCSGFAVFFKYKCLKEGSVEDTSPAESPFDWFNNWKK